MVEAIQFTRAGIRGALRAFYASALFLTASAAPAATLEWNGGVSGTWQGGAGGWLNAGSAANWNNATPDAATFGGGSPTAVLIHSAGITVGNLSITNGAYGFGGTGTLTLNTGAVRVDSGLTAIASNAIAGTAGLTKTGAGLLSLINNNKSYTGTTAINGGAIQVADVGANYLGSSTSGNVTLDGGALYGNFSANKTPGQAFTIGAGGGEFRVVGAGRWLMTANKIGGSGTLTLSFGADTRFQPAATQTGFSGKWIYDGGGSQNRVIDFNGGTGGGYLGTGSGDDVLTVQNSPTLLLRNSVYLGSASQGITLGPGEAKIQAAGSAVSTIAGKLSGPSGNNVQFYTDTAGVLVISNTANSWLGNTSIQGVGTNRLGASGVFPDDGGTVDILSSAVMLDLNGFSEYIGGLSGFGKVDNRLASTAVTLGVGGNTSNTTFQGTLTNSASGASVQLVKVGAGVLTLSGNGIGHSGGTIISNGTIEISAVGAGRLGATSSSAVRLEGGTLRGNFSSDSTVGNIITVGALGGTLRNYGGDTGRWLMPDDTLLGSGTLTLAFGSSNTRFVMANSESGFTGKWVLDSGGNPNRILDIYTGNAFGGATGDDAITLGNTAGILVRDHVVLGSASQGITLGSGETKITIAGVSTSTVGGKISGPAGNSLQFYFSTGSLMILSNTANAWLGGTSLNNTGSGGTLRLGAAGVIPDAGGTVSINTLSILDLYGFDEAIGGLTGAGTVDNTRDGFAATLSVGGNNATTTFSGALQDSGTAATLSLRKTGAGTLTLSGPNSHEGATTVQGGVLRVANAGGLGTAAGGTTVDAGAALELSGGITIASESLTINGTGVSGAGALRNVSGNNTWQGSIAINNGAAVTVASDSGDLKLKGGITLGGAVPPTFGGNGNVFIESSMNGGFVRGSGVGDVLVTGTATVNGDVTVSPSATGALKVDGTVAGAVTISGSQLIGTGTVQEAILDGGTISPGAGGVAKLTLTDMELTGGAYLWNITNAAGTAGVNWDLLSASAGALDLSGAGAGAITVRVSCALAALPNFGYGATSWKIIDAGSVSGFSSSKFTVNDSAFTPGSQGGSWLVTNGGGGIYLSYSPPAPSDIAVSMSASPTLVDVGASLSLSLFITNSGPVNAPYVFVTNTLPSGATYAGGTPAGSASGNVVTWRLTNLAAGASQTLTVSVVAPVVQGIYSSQLACAQVAADLDPPDDRASVSFNVSCPGAPAPFLNRVADQTVEAFQLLSFNVVASNSDCASPFLFDAGIPSGATYSATTNGYMVTGHLQWTPQVSDAGTHLVRWFAQNTGSGVTSFVMRIYVAQIGEAVNGQDIPVSQTNWAVTITNLEYSSSVNATVVWAAVQGVTYDIYRTDQGFGAGQSWSRVVTTAEAVSVEAEASVAASATQRFFQVVPAGGTPTSNGVWGLIKPTIPAGFSMFAPPVVTDRKWDGAMGASLAAALSTSDQIYILNGGSWTILHVDNGAWKDELNAVYTTELPAGQGVYIKRNTGTSAQPVFAGPVGNTASRTNTIAAGWNILGYSEGRNLAVSTMFENAVSGSPTGDNDETLADQIMIQNPNGSWRRLIRLPTGSWYDYGTGGATTLSIKPGQGYYYYRQSEAGDLEVRF